jgi:hypothetical protein
MVSLTIRNSRELTFYSSIVADKGATRAGERCVYLEARIDEEYDPNILA